MRRTPACRTACPALTAAAPALTAAALALAAAALALAAAALAPTAAPALAAGALAGPAAPAIGRPPAPAAVQAAPPEVGRTAGFLPDGRLLAPFGRSIDLHGNFAHGAALTPDGRYVWTVQAGEGRNDVRIVSLARRRVIETIRLPGASGGLAIARDGRTAYLSGVPDATERPGGDVPAGTPGRAGDVIHVLAIDRTRGTARETGVISVAPPAGTPPPQDFPPTRTAAVGWPQGVAVSPDGRTLLVALSLADRAAVVDLPTRRVRYVETGRFPYGTAILADGRTGLVSNEGPGTVTVIDLTAATGVADIAVGPPLSHPEEIAVDPLAPRAYVALANTDGVAVLDTGRRTVLGTVSVARPEGIGEAPVSLSVAPDARRLLVADSGGNDIAVIGLPGGRHPELTGFPLLGRIPTADYPVAALATPSGALPCAAPAPAAAGRSGRAHRRARRRARRRAHARVRAAAHCRKLVWVTAKGLGLGPSVVPQDPRYLDDAERQLGRLGIADFPADGRLPALTRTADRAVRPLLAAAPAATPLRPGGPIEHVFLFVRENRNYDQVLGDLRPGDGDPRLAIFGARITPNLHALARRFGTLDRVFADSEVSIDGHMWTTSAGASDFVERGNHPSNAGRGYPYNFVYAIAAGPGGTIFDLAARQGVSALNFGEGIADVLPIPDRDATAGTQVETAAKFARADLGAPAGCYPADAYIGRNPITGNSTYDSSPPPGAPPGSESRFDCFRTKFALQQLTGSVPALTYLTTVDDHTNGTRPGTRTPQAMVASSDWALGQFVETISHSSIWPHTAIFVVEDDTQEGTDHVDAHRMPAFVISPYSRPGAVVSERYDQVSVLRSIELLLGLPPLTLGDALAAPMYGAFTTVPDLTPYTATAPAVDMNARNTAASPDAALSRRYDWTGIDRVPQAVSDRILWHAVRGRRSAAPPVGPNASAGG